MSFGIGSDDPVIRRHMLGNKTRLIRGVVRSVDPENQTMNIDIPADGQNVRQIANIPINNLITNYGSGVRQMPIADRTIAILYQDTENDYTHIGYYLRQMQGLTLDKGEEKDNSPNSLLQRFLEEGELQISGVLGSEILMSLDGSVLIKNQFGAYVKLENLSSTLEGSFANLYYEMDNVRIRAGNVRRPAGENTTEDKYVVAVDGVAVVEDQIQEGDVITPLKEFIVKAGTTPDLLNHYLDDETIGTTATFFIGDKLINEDGTEAAAANKSLNFLVQNNKGGGIAIDEDGSVLFIDRIGGTVTKFTSGAAGEKSSRIGNTYTTIASEGALDGTSDTISINHTSGSNIDMDLTGGISIAHYLGSSIILDDTGIGLNSSGGITSIISDNIKISGTTLTTLGVKGTDTLLAATKTSSWFDTIFLPALAALLDTHVHAGPAGPVAGAYFTAQIPLQLVANTSVGMSLNVALEVLQAPKVAVD